MQELIKKCENCIQIKKKYNACKKQKQQKFNLHLQHEIYLHCFSVILIAMGVNRLWGGVALMRHQALKVPNTPMKPSPI